MPEIWDAYSADGEKLRGVQLTRDEKVPDRLYHLVAVICVRHTDGTYLLMQRAPEKMRGGKWELSAGGSVLCGESVREGALRELYEETGLSV